MDGVTIFWGWVRGGRRWHLRSDGADRALCGAGKKGWLSGDHGRFDPAHIAVGACVPCVGMTARQPGAAGAGTV